MLFRSGAILPRRPRQSLAAGAGRASDLALQGEQGDAIGHFEQNGIVRRSVSNKSAAASARPAARSPAPLVAGQIEALEEEPAELGTARVGQAQHHSVLPDLLEVCVGAVP